MHNVFVEHIFEYTLNNVNRCNAFRSAKNISCFVSLSFPLLSARGVLFSSTILLGKRDVECLNGTRISHALFSVSFKQRRGENINCTMCFILQSLLCIVCLRYIIYVYYLLCIYTRMYIILCWCFVSRIKIKIIKIIIVPIDTHLYYVRRYLCGVKQI